MTQTVTTTPTLLETGHVGLNVTDLDRSIAFYTKVFGFEVQAQSQDDDRRWAFLAHNGRLMVTLWQQSNGGFPARLSGLHHLSFQVNSLADVHAAEVVLRELGASFQYDGVVPHGEGTSSGGLFFFDPDGIRLEMYAPTGAEGAAAPSADAPTCGFF